MGIYDRDYYRQTPRGGFGSFSPWSVTTWLIGINVAVFILDGMIGRRHLTAHELDLLSDGQPSFDLVLQLMYGPVKRWGFFSTDTAVYHGQLWRFLTFQFLHASPMHLLGNMISLFLFGPIVEAHFLPRRYLAFYLLCGLAGAASYLILGAAHVLPEGPQTPLVGASAGIFGLLVAAAMIAPHVEVYVYFGIPLTVRTLAIIGMAVAAYTVFAAGPYAHNAGGEAAHLGGGVLGFLLMKNQHWLHPFAPRRRTVATTRRRVNRAMQKDWSKDFNR
jgi:membrane associated rhomboid family serine protease